MAANSKDSRMQSRLEKVARESGDVGVHYEIEARAVREKMARLRALRLAKEAADKAAVATGLQAKPAKTEKKSARIAARRT